MKVDFFIQEYISNSYFIFHTYIGRMNCMKSRKLFIITFIILMFGAAAYFCWDYFSARPEVVSYADFYSELESGNIATASFSSDKIVFTKKSAAVVEPAPGQKVVTVKYQTSNPESPTLKEELLRQGAEVSVEKDGTEIISTILDIFFYLIFFIVIFTAFRKFISPNTFKVVHKTGVRFDDVVGMDRLKKDMVQVMEIMKNPEAYAKKGIRMPKGILLEGAPGNGKTLFAKALAGEAKVNFIPTKATDFESMFMAIGPMKVKLLFKKARRRAPCIVFIDEFDGIGTIRNYNGSALETENTRIVTALLNELDGFEASKGVLVIAATNSIKALDPALIRPGRFDAKLTVPYPDSDARSQLVEMYCKGKNAAAECTTGVLVKMFDGFSCAKIESVLNRAALLASQAGRSDFTLEDVRAAIREN